MDSSINKEPLVSIMMTTYNRGKYIATAIESVLSQNYQNWELLIMDDASSDNTATVVQQYVEKDSRIHYHPSDVNLGISKNRNRALSVANGKYVAVLDSDDLWLDQEKLQKQVDFLEHNPKHVLVGTEVVVIDGTGNEMGQFKYEHEDSAIRSKILLRNQFTHSSLLLRADEARQTNYDPELPLWEDYDLILRLGTKGKLANLPQPMTGYRKHSSNISKSGRANGARINLQIIGRHKQYYPNYHLAVMKGCLRLLLALIR